MHEQPCIVVGSIPTKENELPGAPIVAFIAIS